MSTDCSPATLSPDYDAPRESFNELAAEFDYSPSVVDFATAIFKRAEAGKLYRGRARREIFGAAVYMAARHEGHAPNPREIAERINSTREDLLSTVRYIDGKLNLDVKPADPRAFARRFCADLGKDDAVEETAIDIIDTCEENQLTPGSPSGFAAGAVYAAGILTGVEMTQRAIADVADVTTVTIRNWYGDQLEVYEQS